MIKYSFLCILLFTGTFTFANNKSNKHEVFDLRYKDNSINHRYTLVEDTSKQTFILRSIQNKKTKLKTLSKDQGKSLKNYVSNVAWSSQYRKPSSIKKCTEYVVMKTSSAKTKVCREDRSNAGKTLGLLNELHRLVE